MSENLDYINYSCYFTVFREGEQFVSYNALSMVISGEMELNDGEHRKVFKSGDIYLVRKNQLLKFLKRPGEESEFKSLSIRFDDEMLKQMKAQDHFEVDEKVRNPVFVDLSSIPHLKYFMESLLQYQDLLENRSLELALLKQKEALLLLFGHDESLKNIVYDISDPYKINLEEFMLKNYHFNVKLDRFAYLTGRSLAAFKRDFAKIFGTAPGKWLLQKRLQEARYLLEKGKKVSDIYLDLGFEDLSHFSFAFKKQFGLAPSKLVL
ncbi:AraC family transcriptional regulator [Chryseobacterium lactis]|uniref:AraC family transcriptional regulator n=1 Tax=Chryseobacterium lactis TaxID=1241981 RepID=A0A3G6RLL7_CHRLC|nr:AraC family transcriptional regulator [Chryseobacterium lactis]AZA80850.1 AraC family transcriptional regulator [Chryseobacterium lactis]AZB05852.1 AraC family transcriptional regulator [Chryseobacterium lactis]PNW13428.1 AraC family transcriptional regulator [Chryseobacterium lactis]